MLSRGGCGSGGRRQSWGHRGLRADGGGGAGEAGAPAPARLDCRERDRGLRVGSGATGLAPTVAAPCWGRVREKDGLGAQKPGLRRLPGLVPGRTPAGFLTHFPFREKNKSAARCQP